MVVGTPFSSSFSSSLLISGVGAALCLLPGTIATAQWRCRPPPFNQPISTTATATLYELYDHQDGYGQP